MIKKVFLLLIIFSCTLLNAQKFNRSFLRSFRENPVDIGIINSSVYQVSGFGDSTLIYKFGSGGEILSKTIIPVDSSWHNFEAMIVETDSTFLVYGLEHGDDFSDPYSLKLIRYDTALNILNTAVFSDSSSLIGRDFYSIDSGRTLLTGSFDAYLLDHDFTELKRYINKSNSSIINAIYLNSDSIFIQKTAGHFLYRFSDSTEVHNNLLSYWGGTIAKDFSEDKFCIYDFVNQQLHLYSKDSLALDTTLNISNILSFQPLLIDVFKNHLVFISKEGDFAVLNKQTLIKISEDKLKGSFQSLVGCRSHMDNTNIAFVYEIPYCRQIHIETFPLSLDKAPTFGEVKLIPDFVKHEIVGAPYASDNSNYNFAFDVDIEVDLWIKNESTSMLDSFTFSYGAMSYYFQCDQSFIIDQIGVALSPGDSMLVVLTDTFKVNTNTTDSVNTILYFAPAVANGNIISPLKSDSIKTQTHYISIQEEDSFTDINIFPNPVEDILNLNLEVGTKTSIEIYALNGKNLMKQDFFKGNQIELDLSFLEKGLYSIKVISEEFTYSCKFLKI